MLPTLQLLSPSLFNFRFCNGLRPRVAESLPTVHSYFWKPRKLRNSIIPIRIQKSWILKLSFKYQLLESQQPELVFCRHHLRIHNLDLTQIFHHWYHWYLKFPLSAIMRIITRSLPHARCLYAITRPHKWRGAPKASGTRSQAYGSGERCATVDALNAVYTL